MLVVNPSSRFSREETEALRMVRVIRWNGPSTMIHAEFSDGDDSAARQLATRWVSATPYVPLRRYWGTHGKHHLTPEKQLALELHGIGVGKGVAEADVTQQGIVGVRVGTMTRKRHGPGEAPRRRGFRVEFRTHDPICGPVALGHSCHYGLGLFVPAER